MMKWFYNLKVASKLIIGFIVVAIIAAAVGVVGVVNIRDISEKDNELYERYTASLPHLADVTINYNKLRVELRGLYVRQDLNERLEAIKGIQKYDGVILDNMEAFKATVVDQKVMDRFKDLEQAINDFFVYEDGLIELAQASKMDELRGELLNSEAARIVGEVTSATEDLMNLTKDLAREAAEKNGVAAKTSTITMIIIIAIGVVIAIALGLFIAGTISRPVNKMVAVADKIALGDVNVSVEADTKDEIGSLAEALRRMITNIREQALVAERIASGDLTIDVPIRSENDLLGKKLAEIVKNNNEVLRNINNAAEQVESGSKQLSASSIALSEGATEQASSIEELTASIEEISSQTRLNAENADKANQLAESAKINAMKGNEQMEDMLKAIEEINDASSNISKIIKVIDDIAFQTNILALNAAVEAARAGQHGKGFAVVAEEVRNLAARSANAAKETTDLIENSIKKSEGGTKIAKLSAEALSEILLSIEKVADLVNNIAIASNEQAIAIEQVNQGIMQVSEVVQTNSATSEEAAAASEELFGQASLLKELVQKFKIKQNVRKYNDIDELNPEVLKMLERMTESNSTPTSTKEDDEVIKPKIALSDKEFGKY